MAIGINLKKMDEKTDLGVSKFFGDPTVPNEWAENWSDDVIFFCQLKLSDIAAYDIENILPHTGYLYIFLDMEMYPNTPTPMVYYYDGEPDTVIDDFNGLEPEFAHLTQGFEMEFSNISDDAEGIKLFGVPADWNYAEAAPQMLLQFDPLEGDTGFMNDIDGFIYFFFDGEKGDYESLNIHIERS